MGNEKSSWRLFPSRRRERRGMSQIPEEVNRSHADLLATLQGGWMLRECQSYHEELKSCESFKGKFNQFYIEGKTADCSQWREDHEDCKNWTNNSDEEAAKRIIERDRKRIKVRLEGHYGNDVWEKREKPPSEEEWNKPLPEYMTERQRQSYLSLYAKNQKTKDEETEAQLKSVQANLVSMAPTCAI